MAASGDSTLFEDQFTVTNYDQSKYDRVARISAISTDSQTALTLDINVELFPMQQGEHFSLLMATTLSLDGNKDDASKGWRDVGNESTLADMWDYVCHGKIYKFEDVEDGQVM
jgi:DNA-directed RNA polymerase I, II, and III subunit RPABC3